MNDDNKVLIVGACTRAAAASAIRAGLAPRCVDHFADRDLAALCPVERVEPADGVFGLEQMALALPPSAWMYTSPMENHPERVSRISGRHRLVGNPAEVLRAVRDPLRVAEVLRREGLPCADVRDSAEGLSRDGSWLVKPLASGGGRAIQVLDHETHFPWEACYCQKRVAGPSGSAVYRAWANDVDLIGVARQSLGVANAPFVYRGGIGPCPVPASLALHLRKLGRVLTRAFSLAGLFGVDFILHQDEPWLVEVNPRYTASVELFEMANRWALLNDHVCECSPLPSGKTPSEASDPSRAQGPVFGKSVLYAHRPLVAPEILVQAIHDGDIDPFKMPDLADIPWPGTPIGPGQPVLTVYARGVDVDDCASRLTRREEHWRRRLDEWVSRS